MVQTDGNLFKGTFITLEKELADLAQKIQEVGAETLFERICTVQCVNWTLSKIYDRLADIQNISPGRQYVCYKDYVQR